MATGAASSTSAPLAAFAPDPTNQGDTHQTYTIWSNAGRHEWLIADGDTVVKRSGLVFANRAAAKRDLLKSI